MKFRIFDKSIGKYRESNAHNLFCVSQDGEIILLDNAFNDYSFQKNDIYVIELFSGEYDINNSPIYEGDILELDDEKYIVKFLGGKFQYHEDYDFLENLDEMEIVGQILLNG